jgi:hypothetical protein
MGQLQVKDVMSCTLSLSYFSMAHVYDMRRYR